MKYLIWCIIGVIIGSTLAWNGLIIGKIQYSNTENISGSKARLIGLVCLAIALICGVLTTMGIFAIMENGNPLESIIK